MNEKFKYVEIVKKNVYVCLNASITMLRKVYINTRQLCGNDGPQYACAASAYHPLSRPPAHESDYLEHLWQPM